MPKRNSRRTRNKMAKRRQKRRTARKYGGIFGALMDATNSGDVQYKTGQENVSYIAKIKRGFSGSSGHNIEYIIPNNFIMFKNPNSFFTPRFTVHIGKDGIAEPCFIRIAEPNSPSRIKFIEYFIYMGGNWYCMMRIYGINAGVFATWTNIVFYKFTDNSWFNLTNNSITIPADAIVDQKPTDLNLLQRMAMRDSGRIVQITKNIVPITSGDDYYLLRQFRNGQIINASVKQEFAEEAVDIAI